MHLLERGSGRGSAFEVVCVITSEHGFAAAQAIEDRGPAMLTHSIVDFYGPHASIYRDPVIRRAYDGATVELLRAHAPDIVLLDGYLYLLTAPMLEAFQNRILNLHFSDLTIRRADRRPAYPGLRAVRDALADGQLETCATVHLVNDKPDDGAPIVRSWAYRVPPLVPLARAWHADDMLKAYAFAHQEWMIREASGPLLSSALRLVSSGGVDLDRLAGRESASVLPWLVDQCGRMTPPEAVRIRDVLRRCDRVSA